VQPVTIPLQNNLMKMIRQSEVYMMEEAVTQQILAGSSPPEGRYSTAQSQQLVEKENLSLNRPAHAFDNLPPASKPGRLHREMQNAVLASSDLNQQER